MIAWQNLIVSIIAHPVHWAEVLFGVKLWRLDGIPTQSQADFIESCFWNVRTVVPSGHETGKTEACKVLVPLWLLSHPKSFFGLTAASWTAVEDNLIPGIREYVKMQPLLFDTVPIADKWVLGNNHELVGFSPDNAEPMQGWHSKGITIGDNWYGGTFVLVDEASALILKVHQGIESLVGGPNHVAYTGNPIHSAGPFVDAINSKRWTTVHLNSRYTPNVVAKCAPGEEIIPGLCTQQKIDDYEEEYGADSPQVKARVDGIVPAQSEWTFISRDDVELALSRWKPHIPIQLNDDGEEVEVSMLGDPHHDSTADGPLRLGIDVGRSETGDESVLLIRGETTVHDDEKHRGLSEPELIGLTEARLRDTEGIRSVYPDATGIGSGLCDWLENMGVRGVHRVVAGARAHESLKYANVRAEAWGNMKQALKTNLAIPERCRADALQMVDVRYSYTTLGQILLERKEKTKERLGRSPDWADALSFTYARPVGNPAFPSVCQRHKLPLRPTVYPKDGKWMLHYDGYPASGDRLGFLCRATWLTRRAESCTIWVHVADKGSWILFDLIIEKKMPTKHYWQRVIAQSAGHDYMWDEISAPDQLKKESEYHVIDLVIEENEEKGHAAYPFFRPPNSVGGMRGLDEIDRLLIGTMMIFPKDPYWTDRDKEIEVDTDPSKFLRVWPDKALDALERARLKEVGPHETDADKDRPEGLVADGGPIVRCLRLLSVAGAAY